MKNKSTHRRTRTKNPAYMEYPSDILNDELFKSMNMSQRGILWSMRLYCWVNGDVPTNWKNLGDLLGTKENEIRKAFADDKLFEFFNYSEKMDRFFCPDLEAYREELLIKQRRRQENGKAATDVQWQSKRNGNAIPDGMASDMNRNDFDGGNGVKGYLMRVN
jgi:hypothetical protein